jgi:thiosulfate dehydrogenase [quinone] large subunit
MDNPLNQTAERHWPILGLVRLSLGWIFLWAFIDKVWGLGFATEAGKAWMDGVSPTLGFLKFGTAGPFAEFYQSIAGQMIVDWMYMLGLGLVGLALMFGIGLRIAGWAGVVMMLLFWSAVLPPEHNPFMDEHIVYALLLAGVAFRPNTFAWCSLHPGWMKLTKGQRWLE